MGSWPPELGVRPKPAVVTGLSVTQKDQEREQSVEDRQEMGALREEEVFSLPIPERLNFCKVGGGSSH